MKKLKISGICLLIVLFLAFYGCKGPQEVEVSPLTTEIKGGIGDYLEIVEDKYKVVKSQNMFKNWELTFKLKNKKTGDLNADKNKLDFGLTLLDEQGKPINGLNTFYMIDDVGWEASELEKLRSLITESPGSEEWFTLSIAVDLVSDFQEYLPEGVSKFSIRTEIKEVDKTSSESSSSSDSGYDSDNETSSVGNEDWDAVLDDYEDYVDQYIKFYKKAMKGDMDAISEYPALMEKATSFSEKLENAKGNLSSKQIGRMAEIQMKMLNAAKELMD